MGSFWSKKTSEGSEQAKDGNYSWIKNWRYNYEMQGIQNEDGSWVYPEFRNSLRGRNIYKDLMSTGAITLPQVLDYCANVYGPLKCFGSREVLGRKFVDEGDKNIEKVQLGEYIWKSFIEVKEIVNKVATNLKKIGLSKGEKVAILSETREEWLISVLGCLKAELVVVTAHSNLGLTGWNHCLNQTEASTLIISPNVYQNLLKILNDCQSVKCLIVFDDPHREILPQAPNNILTIPFSELINGTDVQICNDNPEQLDSDIAFIMYTSGTSGTPKGVLITHANIFHIMLAFCMKLVAGVGDRYLAVLPLSHIFEFTSEASMMLMGVTICYSSPHTFTRSGIKLAEGSLGDAEVCQPTQMNCVPLILDRILKAVHKNVESLSFLSRMIFKICLSYKKGRIWIFMLDNIIDKFIFAKIRATLGGQLKSFCVGGASLSPNTHNEIRSLFGCCVQVGYGCTETAASGSCMESIDTRLGYCGPVNPFIKMKLQNQRKDSKNLRGEILVGGLCVSKGYYKLASKNEESFFEVDGERWFKTGDVGEISEKGLLRVIDRKGDLVKMSTGEFISLGLVESRLSTSLFIENICLIAKPMKDYIVAIIVPSERFYFYLTLGNRENELPMESICQNKQTQELMLSKIRSHGIENKVTHWEIPRFVHLTSTPWTTENALLTPSQKVKRSEIYKVFSQEIEKMFNF